MSWRADDVLDHEVPCASVGTILVEQPDGSLVSADSRARSKHCTGVVPAGQRHHFEAGDPESRIPGRRRCLPCVREMNPDRSLDGRPILVRVELSYSDGSVRWLEGDAADDWEEAMGSASLMAAVHGSEGRSLPWKEKRT